MTDLIGSDDAWLYIYMYIRQETHADDYYCSWKKVVGGPKPVPCQLAFFFSSVKMIGDLNRRAAFKVLLLTYQLNDVFFHSFQHDICTCYAIEPDLCPLMMFLSLTLSWHLSCVCVPWSEKAWRSQLLRYVGARVVILIGHLYFWLVYSE
jgi:hypothetical protein